MLENERLPWFPCEPGPLLEALSGLKPDQKLVYFVVLLRIYDVWGPCHDPLDALAMRCGINKRRVSDALNALFSMTPPKLYRAEGGGLMNKKAAEVLSEQTARRKGAQARGKEGAGVRWGKDKKNQQTDDSNPMLQLMAKNADRDSDKETLPLLGGESGAPVASGPIRKHRRQARGPVPKDWSPSLEGIVYAQKLGFAEAKIVAMARHCVQHHRKHGKLIADFEAMWENWCDNEVRFARQNAAKAGSSQRPKTFADLAREGIDEQTH